MQVSSQLRRCAPPNKVLQQSIAAGRQLRWLPLAPAAERRYVGRTQLIQRDAMTVLDVTPIAIGLVWCLLIVGFVVRVNRSRRLSSAPTASVPVASSGLVLTPVEFHRDVVPLLRAAWENACFCNREAFKRLTSFEMGSAAALADGQIIINEIIRKKFSADGPLEDRDFEQMQRYVCPQCGSRCQVFWEQFSIKMDRHYAIWPSPPARSSEALFIVGFYGFDPPAQVAGFKRADSVDQFIDSLVEFGPHRTQ